MPKAKKAPENWMQNARSADIPLFREANRQWDQFFELRDPVGTTATDVRRLKQQGWVGIFRKPQTIDKSAS